MTFLTDGGSPATGGDATTVLMWDLRDLDFSSQLPARNARTPELDVWWKDLADIDAEKAHEAMMQMLGASTQTVANLKRLSSAVAFAGRAQSC